MNDIPPTHLPSQPLQLAEFYAGIGRYAKALDILKANPEAMETVDWWQLRAQSLYRLGRLEEAEKSALRGLRLSPEDSDCLLIIGNIAEDKGLLHKAETAYIACLKQSPEEPWFLSTYGRLCALAGQPEKAKRLIAMAHTQAPHDEFVLTQQVITRFLEDDDEGVERSISALLRENPESEVGRFVLAYLLMRQGKVDNVAPILSRLVMDSPGDESLVEAAYHAQFASHPFMRPIVVLQRIGSWKFWLGALVAINLLNALDLTSLANGLTLIFVLFAIYRWFAPSFILNWLKERRL